MARSGSPLTYSLLVEPYLYPQSKALIHFVIFFSSCSTCDDLFFSDLKTPIVMCRGDHPKYTWGLRLLIEVHTDRREDFDDPTHRLARWNHARTLLFFDVIAIGRSDQ